LRSLNIKYIPELDQLRGIAALLVVFFHGVAGYYLTSAAGLPVAGNLPRVVLLNAYAGVTLFFVISGFLFTWGALGVERIDWKQFFTNRALRILPMYLLMVAVAFSIARGNWSFGELVQDLAGLSNLHHAQSDFDIVIWTISVELQFYLLFPFLIFLLKQRGPRLMAGLISVMVMLRLIAYAGGVGLHDSIYYTLFGRLDQFLIGMLVAWWVFRRRWLTPGQPRTVHTAWLLAGLTATVVLMVAVYGLYTHIGWKNNDTIVQVVWPDIEGAMWAAFGLLYVALVMRHRPRVLRAVEFAGVISYSIYLLHWPILKGIHHSNWVITWPGHLLVSGVITTAVIALPLVIGASILTYNVIEKPPLALRRRYATFRPGPAVTEPEVTAPVAAGSDA
jgi:peptidoglycan/LPS O-acetylase OafA/YrhL